MSTLPENRENRETILMSERERERERTTKEEWEGVRSRER
jgi:hypothetical protein